MSFLTTIIFNTGSKYFAPLVEYLVCNLGYTRKKDLRGAPFDWRLAPCEYFIVLDAIIIM